MQSLSHHRKKLFHTKNNAKLVSGGDTTFSNGGNGNMTADTLVMTNEDELKK